MNRPYEPRNPFPGKAPSRDHRQLGRELELFFFSEDAPGMPYWLPKGMIILGELLKFWREEHRVHGYLEFSAPLVHRQKMWEISGHWQHYRDDMFLMPDPQREGQHLGLKPMNCPDAMVVFNHRRRSYRDLPFRLSDCDPVHRAECSGALHGLLRVRKFSQDDAHIFVAPDQVADEMRRILALVDRFYAVFGLRYRFRLGLRPSGFLGDGAQWDQAERELEQILIDVVGHEGFTVKEGDGAFYGPKIDILMQDAMDREWQMGTVQLDFQLPRRFACRYVDRDGQEKVPVVIHRVIYGSIERFIGLLLEHCAGALPLWLAPVQAVLLPVDAAHASAADALCAELGRRDIRAEVLRPAESLGYRVRQARLARVPYVLVIGDREAAEGSVAVRRRGAPGAEVMPVQALIDEMVSGIRAKR